MRVGNGYDTDAVEKGGDANVAERKRLTEKQKAFCFFCAAGMAPYEAAKECGYVNVAKTIKKMAENENIQKEIKRLQKKGVERLPESKKEEKPSEATALIQRAAEKREILNFLTDVMRDSEEADLKTRMKAAELLGRRESLFEKEKKPEEKSRIYIVDDIP